MLTNCVYHHVERLLTYVHFELPWEIVVCLCQYVCVCLFTCGCEREREKREYIGMGIGMPS